MTGHAPQRAVEGPGTAPGRFRATRPVHAAVAALLGLAIVTPALPAIAADDCRPPTLEAIVSGELSPSPPGSFAWSPGGTRVAWIETREGARWIRVRDLATAHDTSLMKIESSPDAPGGRPFDWAPDDSGLVVSSGGDLWRVPVPGNGAEPTPRQVTDSPGSEVAPRYSPDGRRIGFIRDADLYVVDPATGHERRLTDSGSASILNGRPDWVYEEEFGLHEAWWWDPSGQRVAYLQFDQDPVPGFPIVSWEAVNGDVTWQRYPKAGNDNATVRIGVVAVEDAGEIPATRWIDAGLAADDYLPRAGWTPSGGILVQRLDRAQKRLELLRCDVADAGCTSIVTEEDPHWINIGDDLAFIPAGRYAGGFVRGSERDGWRHLYLHDAQGMPVRRLTSGSWMVTALAGIDADGTQAFFTATLEDPLQRHLYRVPLDGGAPVRLTRRPGWHVTWVSPDGASWIDQHSTATHPPITRLEREGSPDVAIDGSQESPLESICLGRVDFMEAPAADGTRLPAVMIRPPDFDPARRYPVLVYVYGGPHAQLVRDGWLGERALWHHFLASRGYIIWTLDNRGAAGRGHGWETPIDGHLGEAELSDQRDGVAWLRTRPWVDPARIGVWGWSYGGFMTLTALFKDPGLFRTGIAVAPVTAWENYDTIYTERYMGLPARNEEGYRQSDPRHHAGNLQAPLFLVHGTADDNVHMQNSIQLLEALVKAGKPVRFMLYPGRRHGLEGADARRHLYEAMTRFLEETLPAAPSP